MVWQDARWRWPLLVLGIVAGCILAFVAQPGAASTPADPLDQGRLAVSSDAGGTARVTLPGAESGSMLRQTRWLYAAVAASAVLLAAAIQYRALRRLQERRRFAPASARPVRNRTQPRPAPDSASPWPAADPDPPGEPAWSPGLNLHPGIGD